MKVKDVLPSLLKANPEAELVVNDNGSIFATANPTDPEWINTENGEFCIYTKEWED
jgi:hypothetical protein